MAEKKTTAKKAAPKKAQEVKTSESLAIDIQAKRADYLQAKQSHAAGELVNPRILTTTRKEIARLMTAHAASKRSEKESK